MATTSASTSLSNQMGRAIATARGHHLIVDSPPPLGGPNEELNPLDLLLAALATCGTFVIETAARERNISLRSVALDVAGDFDPRGVKGIEGINPMITEFRVKVSIEGATQVQKIALVEQFKVRCPVYTTLSRATAINFEIM
jgi:putative redox protein